MAAPYVELQLLTHHLFLRAASDPRELFAAASLLGYDALGVADLGTVGGMVRCWEAARTTAVRLLAGARVDLDDGRRLLLYATDRASWSRLTRLLTVGKTRGGKGKCIHHHGPDRGAPDRHRNPDEGMAGCRPHGQVHEDRRVRLPSHAGR